MMKNHKNPIRHNQIPHHNTENYKKWQADFLEKVLTAIFLGNSNQLGKKSPPPAGTPFPGRFPAVDVQRSPTVSKIK
ncbi:hypothetical protein [Enterocloster clostridioformis]|uniref:hypothetical protein n=2 Tax=Lachnospirales TaxID=3085636 RepID=UPI00232C32C7|nr:hypothetical protein [Enterocloster clostridioformis]MDB2143740.1 hypothetical protein [Enterocloster clostridioformis]MDB2146727.1 hypothetical protein [Enterocloster clostridioformis]